MNKDIKSIGIPYYNVRSWYFRRPFHGPEHWDLLVDTLQSLVTREFPYFEPNDYWIDSSKDSAANVFAVVRACFGYKWAEVPEPSVPALELSLNRSGDLFCLSLSVVDFYDINHHELADEVSDKLNHFLQENIEDVYCNPF